LSLSSTRRARYDALIASAPRDPLAALIQPNAASAAMDRLQAAFEAHDWAAVRALAAEGARFEDRRRHALVSGDVDWWIADLKQVAKPEEFGDFHYHRTLVATAGDRIGLERVLWTGGPADGRVEVEYLWLAESDESGRLVAGVMFDADDRRAAHREALSRLIAADSVAAASLAPLSELLERYNDNDPIRMRALLPHDFVWEDHRRTGVGRIEGVDAFLDSLDALWGLVRGIQVELLSLHAIERDGVVGTARTVGTLADGGDFEVLFAAVITAAGGRITRIEQFEIDRLDAALARLAELRPDPLRIPANAATRAALRWHEAVAAGDFEFVEAFFAPTLVFDDRTRRSLLRGDRELLLANDRLIAASRPRSSIAVLATAGDRLALQHVTIVGDFEDAPFEIEFLQIVEVDGDGRLVASIAFDPDDRRAASAELFERYARSEAGRWLPPSAVEFRRALLDRDLERIRAALPDDFVFDDHRRTGLGRLESADRYVAGLAAQYELAPDTIFEPLYYPVAEKHGYLAVFRMFGSLFEGGAFEGVFVRLELYEGDRIVAAEAFELEDLELARARFEELRPDPMRIPANAASRARDRSFEAWQARDWEALRALASPDFRFEDRSKRALVSGDVETWIENNRFMPPGSGKRELIGTAGDRISLERVLWRGEPDGGAAELEHLRLTEVDAEGRIRATIRFDPDDRAAAFAEAQARFAAGEAAAVGGQAPMVALDLAIRRHDWESLRRCLGPDAVFHDHRLLSLGELGCDARVESLRVQLELAPDVQAEVLRILAWNRHGRVHLVRRFGTLREGGPFENFFLSVALTEGDHVPRYEVFEVAETDRALARFAELCAARA
jgi:ketosteroid isomerase-like protein